MAACIASFHTPAARATLIRAAAMRLRLRRDQHHVQLAVTLGRTSDALLAVLSIGVASRNADIAADREIQRRRELDCWHDAPENPYDGKVYCRGCGALLFVLAEGEHL